MFAFIKALTGQHGKKAVQGVVDKVVEFDPQTATAAQLQVMEDDLRKASNLVAKLQTDAKRERREAEAIRDRYNLQARGASILFEEYKGMSDDNPRKVEIAASLEAMTAELESLQNDVALEEQEANEAEQFLREAEDTLREKGQQLLEAKKHLGKATRELERAKVRKERAEAQAETAAQVAGLRNNDRSSMNGALAALQSQAEKANSQAEAARLRAEVLKKPTLGSSDDPNVQRALAAAKSGGALPSPSNLEERLAALGAPVSKSQSALPSAETTAS